MVKSDLAGYLHGYSLVLFLQQLFLNNKINFFFF